jgi:hypothetical protein
MTKRTQADRDFDLECGRELERRDAKLDTIYDGFDQILHQWQIPSYLRLHAGEMSAQEVRTVGAVLKAIRAALRQQRTDGEKEDLK